MKNKECKRHRWRVGSGIGDIIEGKIETIGLNIWCEKCDKKLVAYYNSEKPILFNLTKKNYRARTSSKRITR